MGVVDEYKKLDIALTNRMWSWSGISADGKTVAVTLWQDQFTERGTVYMPQDTGSPEWRDSLGFRQLIDHLAYAQIHTEGLVRVMIAEAKDRNARPRSIKEIRLQKNLRMRVEALDPEAKTFLLRRVDAA